LTNNKLHTIARALALLLCCLPVLVLAEISFPPLTARVMDNADMLAPEEEQQLDALLAEHEKRTTNQIVVLTLDNLQGYTIEDYGYQLGRHWGIGQKDKNNGAVLIVARQERKVRIEVGYGLEGILTDAMSSVIIQNEIVPSFRQGQFSNGITQGVSAIVKLLDGEYQPPEADGNDDGNNGWIILLFIIIWIIIMFLPRSGRHGGYYGGGGGFGGGGFGGGGGFTGGGGGFGGGGASGGW
jgi:uncharacterized protein